jgi:hypothetical protein
MNLYIIILLCVLIGILLYTNRCEQFSDTDYGNKNNNSVHLDPSTQLTNKKASNSGLFNINKSALNL